MSILPFALIFTFSLVSPSKMEPGLLARRLASAKTSVTSPPHSSGTPSEVQTDEPGRAESAELMCTCSPRYDEVAKIQPRLAQSTHCPRLSGKMAMWSGGGASGVMTNG